MYQSTQTRKTNFPIEGFQTKKTHQKTYTKAHAQIPQRSHGKENEAKEQSNEKIQPTWKQKQAKKEKDKGKHRK